MLGTRSTATDRPARTTRRRGAAAPLTAVLLLVAVGCGDGNGESTEEQVATSTTTEERVATSTACGSVSTSPALERLDVEVDGTARTSFVHLPTGWDGEAPLPVVVSFHGADANPDVQRLSDGWVDKADQDGIVILHPAGLTVDVNDQVTEVTGWDVTGRQVDEHAFVSTLLDELGEQVCIDLSRVYATGMSNGADMAVSSACALPEQIAAVARVSAGNTSIPCDPSPPTPTIAFHGTDDEVVPYAGAPEIGSLPVEEALGEQAERNGCTEGRNEESAASTADTLTWEGCEAPTVLYRVQRHGHAWPGHPIPFPPDIIAASVTPPNSVMVARGLTPAAMADNLLLTNTDIDATDIIWDFFGAL